MEIKPSLMKGSDCMTVTIAVERNAAVEVTCEWERNCYHARVYENWGGDKEMDGIAGGMNYENN